MEQRDQESNEENEPRKRAASRSSRQSSNERSSSSTEKMPSPSSKKRKAHHVTKRQRHEPRPVGGEPITPLSAYNYFYQEQRLKWKNGRFIDHTEVDERSSSDPQKPSMMATAIGKRWKQLKPEDKAPYEVLAKQDQERYQQENTEYKKEMLRSTELGRASLEGRLGTFLKRGEVSSSKTPSRAGLLQEQFPEYHFQAYINHPPAASRQTEDLIGPRAASLPFGGAQEDKSSRQHFRSGTAKRDGNMGIQAPASKRKGTLEETSARYPSRATEPTATEDTYTEHQNTTIPPIVGGTSSNHRSNVVGLIERTRTILDEIERQVSSQIVPGREAAAHTITTDQAPPDVKSRLIQAFLDIVNSISVDAQERLLGFLESNAHAPLQWVEQVTTRGAETMPVLSPEQAAALTFVATQPTVSFPPTSGGTHRQHASPSLFVDPTTASNRASAALQDCPYQHLQAPTVHGGYYSGELQRLLMNSNDSHFQPFFRGDDDRSNPGAYQMRLDQSLLGGERRVSNAFSNVQYSRHEEEANEASFRDQSTTGRVAEAADEQANAVAPLLQMLLGLPRDGPNQQNL